MSLDNEYGRADEDGTVYVKTAEGEVRVGQYLVGSAAEGLKHFTDRFNDLATRTELTLKRLMDGQANAEAGQKILDEIKATLESPTVVGNLETLKSKIADIEKATEARKEQLQAAKAEAKSAAVAKREELVKQAEALAASNAWKVTSEAYKNLLDEWKKIPTYERAVEQELWKRFSHARSQFDKARRAHFNQLDAARTEASAAKNEIIAKAKELAESTDWAEGTKAFRGLMEKWKGLARAARSEEDKLWAEFKAAQDKFFDSRNAANSERDGELSENLVAKSALVDEAEKLLPITDVDSVKKALRDIASKWEKIGHVPRADRDKIEKRLRSVEDAVRKFEEDIWRKTKPEVQERASGLVALFETSVEKLEKQVEQAVAAGDKNLDRLKDSLAQAKENLEAARKGAKDIFGK